jgi:hypothetical protein
VCLCVCVCVCEGMMVIEWGHLPSENFFLAKSLDIDVKNDAISRFYVLGVVNLVQNVLFQPGKIQ